VKIVNAGSCDVKIVNASTCEGNVDGLQESDVVIPHAGRHGDIEKRKERNHGIRGTQGNQRGKSLTAAFADDAQLEFRPRIEDSAVALSVLLK